MIVCLQWTLIIFAVASGAAKHNASNHSHGHEHGHGHNHHHNIVNVTEPTDVSHQNHHRGTESPVYSTESMPGPVTKEPDMNDINDVVYLLPPVTESNSTAISNRCREILITCQNTSSNFTTITKEGPMRSVPHHYSSLIQYRPKRGMLNIPIEVTDDFLQHLVLLHNNTDQLHVLLALLSSFRGDDWMTYLAGYNECGRPSSNIFTCVNDTCTQHDLHTLKYTNDLFAEDVIGLELLPPTVFVLVRLYNKATKASGVIRVKADTVSLLDVTYNLIRAVFDDIPGLNRELVKTLYLYRERYPGVFSITEEYRARTFPHHKL